MNTERKQTNHERGLRITLIAIVAAAGLVAACGTDNSDDSASSTASPAEADSTQPLETTPTTEEPTTTEGPGTTAAPNIDGVRGRSDELTFVNDDVPTCTYRNSEILSRAEAVDIENALGVAVTDLGQVTPDESEIAPDLHLFNVEMDPLDAATQLFPLIDASPNYIYAFAPGWQYAPYDDPAQAEQIEGVVPLSNSTAQIAVLDTGWAVTAEGTPATTTTTTTASPGNPTPPPEVLDGRAAGHGTFIVNLLGQLLPNATFIAGGIGPRFASDDNYELSDASIVSIRDDYTVTRALAATVGTGVPYLNMSFGSYGCTAMHVGNVEAEGMEPYFTPLGLRVALEQLAEGSPMQAFAASGNDGYDELAPEIFYPAGWAPLYPWLHSVASDPKDGVDYSNRGTWVQTQARGTRTVSLLPDTNEWGLEKWAAWSGTSFATPCALAMFVAGNYVEYVTSPNSEDYMDCGINLP